MSDVKKIATRESYGRTLVELGKENDKIVVLDADLAESTKTGVFKKAFPERHFDCGIAEADMIGIAAGLAAAGMVPFASSFAMFAAGRAFEQIRNSVGYPHLNVKICATHAGVSVGEDGATHQCNEDIALMRTIPGMVVINPADATEAAKAVEAAIEHEGPVYLRFGRMAVPVLYGNDYDFKIGRGTKMAEGNDVSIICAGIMVEQALGAREILASEGICASVVNMATIKPIDETMVIAEAQRCGAIVTAEEHSVIGGLGAAVCETLARTCPVPVIRTGIKDTFGKSGTAKELITYFGLDAQSIAENAKAAIALKK
mgnify:CR=1 FL=1